MAAPILEFNDLTLGYGAYAAVHHLSGKVERGSSTAILGSNGSGKSTLLKGIAGLVKPMAGAGRKGGKAGCGFSLPPGGPCQS